MFVDQGFDGETIITFAGKSFEEVVSPILQAAPYCMKNPVHLDRVMIEFNKFFDAKLYPIQEVAGAQSSPAPVRAAPTPRSCAGHLTRTIVRRRNPTLPITPVALPCHMPTPCSPTLPITPVALPCHMPT
jgi:hypothetical protein